VLKENSLCVSFYGWDKVDLFMGAWRAAGLRPVGQIIFCKPYASSVRYLSYRHEGAYLLAKGFPPFPDKPPPEVMGWEYSGNRLHPTQKPVASLKPLIAAFTKPGQIVLDPFAGSGSTLVAARAQHAHTGLAMVDRAQLVQVQQIPQLAGIDTVTFVSIFE